MIGVEPFTRGKVVGTATFYRENVWLYLLISRASLYCLPSHAVTTYLRPERLE